MGRDNLEKICKTNNRNFNDHNLHLPLDHSTQQERINSGSGPSSCNSPTSISSLPEHEFSIVDKEREMIPKSKSVSTEEKSSGRGFFASLFNL